MRYIIAPLDFTTEELEIYKLLYDKMDFETFIVSYTLEQLAFNSNKKLKITKKMASNIIKKFVEDGYITILQKGTKGKATIYQIIKLNDLEKLKRNLKETQKKLKRNLKETYEDSDIKACGDFEKLKRNLKETQKKLKRNTKETTTKEKENDKENDKINNIWSMYPRKEGKAAAIKQIPKIINAIGEDHLIRCIERYNKKIEIENISRQYIKQGSTFFNGGYVDYLDENYQEPEIQPGNYLGNNSKRLKASTYQTKEATEVEKQLDDELYSWYNKSD